MPNWHVREPQARSSGGDVTPDFVEADEEAPQTAAESTPCVVNSTATGKTADASGDCPSGRSPGLLARPTEPHLRRTCRRGKDSTTAVAAAEQE